LRPTSRELRRPRLQPVAETYRRQYRSGLLAPFADLNACVEQTVGHVLEGGGVLGEKELLEDEADPGCP
jgi:hypothetical protein